jgi:carboxyl-terminal processing protease
VGLLLLPAPLGAQTAGPEDLRAQASDFEKRRDWLEACRAYDEILRKERGERAREEARQGYQRCLRRYLIARRHADRGYREALARLSPGEALEMYEQVLRKVSKVYLDGEKADLTALFQQGLEEVRLALDEKAFRRAYLPGAAPDALEAFKAKLNEWRGRKIASPSDARIQALAVARTARELGLVPRPRPAFVAVLSLEFACGACNGLDEYTFFLTPSSFGDAQATLDGRMVSVGIDLTQGEQKLSVLRVYPRSPAQEAGLLRYDRVLRIDRKSVEDLPAEKAAELLRGDPGTVVEVEVLSAGMMPRVVKLVRRAVIAPTVEYEPFTIWQSADGMMTPVQGARVRILSFQEATLQEVKEALAVAQTAGMKVLILDLRGNPGGLFHSAVDVARLFLPDGLIVLTQSRASSKYNRPYRAGSMNPLLVPMAVLVDGDTASAAEVLAGAMQENGRAILIGQTTFGKCTIQCLVPLAKPPFDKMPGGVRITVARFFWPERQPSSGSGIVPTITYPTDGDAVVDEAKRELLKMLDSMSPMTMPR